MESLPELAAAIGLGLTAAQREQFEAYEALLLQWNARISLTAIRDPSEVRIRHFLDSLTCATVTGSLEGLSLIDVGTGAGFPGIPLKIVYPGLQLTLVDSVAKKTRFLEAVVAELALSDVALVSERAEALGRKDGYRERFDWAVARAVAELRVLAEYLLPLCKVGGHALAQKGESAAREIAAAENAVQQLGGGNIRLTSVRLPGVEQAHNLVVIPKLRPTDGRYPRRVGMPAKRPL